MLRRLLPLTAIVLALGLGLPGSALAHEERASQFPAGTGSTPTYRTLDQAAAHLVVCKPSSKAAIAKIADPKRRAFNNKLLGQCRFQHIQAAVDAVNKQRTNIYVLPGLYREEPSWDHPCTKGYDGGLVEYDKIVSCGEVLNLVTIAGDSPKDPDRTCDNQLCKLQIEGTGARKEDVVLRGGFRKNGDWIKHNGIKADRADGFYLRNLTAELFKENALYVHETDGYALDRVNARHNDLYGILTFTSDHGLIQDCDASYNGDSGVYPGSSADVNQGNAATGRLKRFAVEIRRCDTHHNALGFSGTAGNSVWFHDNLVRDNSAGYVTDSFVGGHPGMPQDHAWLANNRIFRNNNNYVQKYVQSGICDKPPGQRGYGRGTVCPVFPVPVGTGVMIAGGNRNLVENNLIYDNWRQGVMLFWVPAALRGENGAEAQVDTSNGNHFVNNTLGRSPSGLRQPNGTDFWWDEQGIGNCWEGNKSVRGTVTHNVALPTGLPTCADGGSLLPLGNAVKSATLVPCSEFNREDNQDPPGCDWFDSPAAPADRQAERGEQPPVTGSGLAALGSSGAFALTSTGKGTTGTDAAVLGVSTVALVASLVAARRVRRRRSV